MDELKQLLAELKAELERLARLLGLSGNGQG